MKREILHGDCLELMKGIPDGSIDMVLCDLPYGTTNCKWDSTINLELLWEQYKRVVKKNGAILLFAQVPFSITLGYSNLSWLRYDWTWEKAHATGHLNAKKMPMKAHEVIMVFYKNLPTYNPQKTYGHIRKISSSKSRGKSIKRQNDSDSSIYNKETEEKVGDYNSTERYPRSVLKFSSETQTSNLHPTQKPISLCEYFIKTYTNEGDLVLDNAAGSGTTAIAAINTNRQFIVMEKEEKYYKGIVERVNNCLIDKFIR